MSRSKMTDLIKAGDVKVNWRVCDKVSTEVKQGDIISLAGKGRVELKGVATTKKDKFNITMLRFV